MAYTTINKGSSYFNTVLYTGTGATNNITGVGFKPDFTWIKNRGNTDWHRLLDAVRGATNELYSNATNAETAQAQSLQTFNTDGFTLGTLAEVNGNANTFASWNWLASNTTTANTSGTISSTVSANTTAGFSIVSYTGTGSVATVGHGLGVAPSFYIVKRRNDTGFDWFCYHKSLGATKFILLDTSGAEQTGTQWNDTAPTSSVFSVGSPHGSVNASGGTYIAYCFAEVKGYSKFGSYTGNGNSDGTFIYTGFKPAFVLTKRTDSGDWWGMWDSKRLGYNGSNYFLRSNTNDAEANKELDILSNGFKIRTVDGGINASGGTYIYMCFAENPFVTSTQIPTTAR